MTDLEMTRLCAEAMGFHVENTALPNVFVLEDSDGVIQYGIGADGIIEYEPLYDDAQAMALVKKFRMTVYSNYVGYWFAGVLSETPRDVDTPGNENLNRTIVECVAKMQKAKA